LFGGRVFKKTVNIAEEAQVAANDRSGEMFDHANLRNETKNLLENGFDISKSKNSCTFKNYN